MTKMVDCPRCGGTPDCDEDGRPFTCFFCFDTGRVAYSVVAAERLALVDLEERFAPAHLGIFPAPMPDEYDFDGDWEAKAAPGCRLFTRLIRAARPVVACAEFDDIPF